MGCRNDTKAQGAEPAKPLSTRHVLLDTDVYHSLRHNPANPALRTLGRHIAARTIVLHVTDITLREVKQQLGEDVDAVAREVAKSEKILRRWRHAVPQIGASPELNPAAISEALYNTLERAVLNDWSAILHRALDVPASGIFDDYFARRAPFDRKGAKEFPDAFALRALAQWCVEHRTTAYVVTQDKAMNRAVEAEPGLRSIPTIEQLLARASVQPDLDGQRIAGEVVAAPEFDFHLEQALASHQDEIIFDYRGDLPEVEIVDQSLGEIEAVSAYSVAWVGPASIALIITVDTAAFVTLQYEDRSLAMYDNEDGIWFGGTVASMEVERTIGIEMFVEVDFATRAFISSELLQTDYAIAELPDWLK